MDDSARLHATNELIGEHLRAGRLVRFTIPTTSMLPILQPGDVVVVQAIRAADLRVGDILVRQIEQVWLAHRVIECRETRGQIECVTKGDHQVFADRPEQATATEAIVVALQGEGRVKNFRRTHIKFLFRLLANLGCWQTRFSSQRIVRKSLAMLISSIAFSTRKLA